MESGYLILVVIFIVCLFLRTGYELLKEARRIDPESKLIFAIILAVMCALWASWFELCSSDPFQINLSETLRWSGFALFAVGMFLAVGALVQLRGVENIDHLVTTDCFPKSDTRCMPASFCGFLVGVHTMEHWLALLSD